ncbi:MAG: pyridoxal phosphate-dependent aminotransferase [bacterium]
MNPLIARAGELQRNGRRIIDLSSTNFHEHGIRYPDAALASYFGEYFGVRNYTPHSLGRLETRLAVSNWYAERNEPVDPARIILTASTSESYSLIFEALSGAGESVLLPSPTYPLFEQLCTYARLNPVYYSLDAEQNFAVDFESVRQGLALSPAFAVTISPNNPTGAVLSGAQKREFARLCSEVNVPLIEDEVFVGMEWTDPEESVPVGGPPSGRASHEFPRNATPGRGGHTPDASTTAGQNPGLPLRFKLGGLSKLFASPDVKLAWIAIQGSDPESEAIERLELASDTYLNASEPSQFVAARMFAEGDTIRASIRSELRSRVQVADRLLCGSDRSPTAGQWPVVRDAKGAPYGRVRVFPQAGGIHRVIHVPGADDELLAGQLLEEAGVLVHPGYFYGFPDDGYWVMSTVSREGLLEEGLDAVSRFLGLR